MNSTVLVINSGSSSIKYQLIEPNAGVVVASGLVERIGEEAARLRHTFEGQDTTLTEPVADHGTGLRRVLELFGSVGPGLHAAGIVAVGHRVVQPALAALAVVSLVAAALGLATGSTASLALGAGLFGVSFGALQTTTLDVSMRRVPQDPSTVSAVWNMAFDGGTAAGAAVIGFIAGTALGAGWAMGLGAAGVAVVLLIGLVTRDGAPAAARR